MDEEAARAVLSFSGELNEDGINAAYQKKVKEYHAAGTLEEKLQELNMARDFLKGINKGTYELAPYLDRSLAKISADQARVIAVQEAKEELTESFSAVERARVRRFRSSRDFAGILSAASVALTFGRENLADTVPALANSPTIGTALLMTSVSLACLAYFSNRNANIASDRLKEANRKLIRSRAVSRVLARTFDENDSLTENQFEERLATAMMEEVVGRNRGRRPRILDAYASIGLPISPVFRLDENLVSDYVDFLIKASHVNISGTSGVDLLFNRPS